MFKIQTNILTGTELKYTKLVANMKEKLSLVIMYGTECLWNVDGTSVQNVYGTNTETDTSKL